MGEGKAPFYCARVIAGGGTRQPSYDTVMLGTGNWCLLIRRAPLPFAKNGCARAVDVRWC